MNYGTVTGGVVKGAVSAYTASTRERASVRRVSFSLATRDHFGADGFWNCEAEGNPELLDFLEAGATPGAGIKIDYELAGRRFYRNGVHVGESRFLRVLSAEISGRRCSCPMV